MIIQLTCDKRGVSVWPADVKLRFEGKDGDWFDEDCRVRGTNGSSMDWHGFSTLIFGKAEYMAPGTRYTLNVSDVKLEEKHE